MFHTSLTSSISQVIKVTLIQIEFNKEEASGIKNLKQKLFKGYSNILYHLLVLLFLG